MFDTDKNGLVDALELFMTVALLSGMDTIEKLLFAFSVYDFDSCSSLSLDETALLLRSAAKGLSKACPEYTVFSAVADDESIIETYAKLIFEYQTTTVHPVSSAMADRVSLDVFKEYCSTHVIVSSWLNVLASMPSFDNSSGSEKYERAELLLLSSTNTSSLTAPNYAGSAKYPKKEAAVLSEADYKAFQALIPVAIVAEEGVALAILDPIMAPSEEAKAAEGGEKARPA